MVQSVQDIAHFGPACLIEGPGTDEAAPIPLGSTGLISSHVKQKTSLHDICGFPHFELDEAA
jgi:hypothetical protein